MNGPASFDAVMIDLDGTLADTAGEIARALNTMLEECRIAPLEPQEVAMLVGRGVQVLVDRALDKRGAVEVDRAAAARRFHYHYARTVATDARLYPGAREGVAMLRAARRKVAVVTNKPRSYSERLLEFLRVTDQIDALVAGDDGIAKKPAGDMLVAACEKMAVQPGAALMLGDSANDVLAARAAGCAVWCVPYGYNEGLPAGQLACDRIVASIEEAARLLAAGGSSA